MTRCKFCGRRSRPYTISNKKLYLSFTDICPRCIIPYERGVSDAKEEHYKSELIDRVNRLEKTNKSLEAIINKFVQDEKVEE